jgi:hypothetical protein
LNILIASLFLRNEKDDKPVITLERSQCLGTCPAYELNIYSNGTVKFIGAAYVLVRDTVVGKISVDSVHALLDEAQKIGFFQFQDEYRNCNYGNVGETVTDLPTTIVTVTMNGLTKKVLDYYCAPESLPQLESHIDRATRSLRWIGLDGDRNLTNYVDFNDGQFPGADSLRTLWHHEDSLLKEGKVTFFGQEYSALHRGSVLEYERRFAVACKPLIDSMVSARSAILQSLTDSQIDSIYDARSARR